MLYTVIFCYTHTYTLLTFRFHITPPHSSNAFAVDGEKTSNHHFFAENTCQSWWIYSRQLGHRWKHSSKECAFATWPCWDVFFDHFFTPLFGSSLLLFALVPWSLDPLVPWSAPGWAGQERQALFIDGSNETEVCFSGQPMAICCAFGAGAESQIEMVIPLKKK